MACVQGPEGAQKCMSCLSLLGSLPPPPMQSCSPSVRTGDWGQAQQGWTQTPAHLLPSRTAETTGHSGLHRPHQRPSTSFRNNQTVCKKLKVSCISVCLRCCTHVVSQKQQWGSACPATHPSPGPTSHFPGVGSEGAMAVQASCHGHCPCWGPGHVYHF